MKFEEVLPLMREGKKAKHAKMKDGEYWICGTQGFKFDETIPSWPTIIKVFKNPFESESTTDGGIYAWGIERWTIMENTWEVVEE